MLFTTWKKKPILFLFHSINVGCLPTENYPRIHVYLPVCLPAYWAGAWERIRKCRWAVYNYFNWRKKWIIFRNNIQREGDFVFLFFIFSLLRRTNETNAFIFRCQLWQIVWKIINRNLRPSSLTSSITLYTETKTEKKKNHQIGGSVMFRTSVKHHSTERVHT